MDLARAEGSVVMEDIEIDSADPSSGVVEAGKRSSWMRARYRMSGPLSGEGQRVGWTPRMIEAVRDHRSSRTD